MSSLSELEGERSASLLNIRSFEINVYRLSWASGVSVCNEGKSACKEANHKLGLNHFAIIRS